MIYNEENSEGKINRRTILKSAAAASAAGLIGVPAVSGSAVAGDVAGHPSSDFDLHGIDHKSDPNKLVKINSQDLVPGGGPTTVDLIDLSTNVNVNTLAAHPFEESGVRWFYSTDLDTNKAFRVHPDKGTVEHFGTANSVLAGIAGSAIIVDSSDNPHWYGITHAGANPPSTLFEINLSDGSTTEKGGLHVVEGGESTPVTATHLGMGVNFLTNELWGVIGDPDEPSANSRVFKVVDIETGEVDIVDSDAMTGGRSVGAALGPCASIMFAVRTGNDLFGYDVESGDEYSYGELEYESGELDFDSLAVPYGFECCTECSSTGALAKYEFECVEKECVEWETEDEESCLDWECVNWDFELEGDSEDGISYAGDNYENKGNEENEPLKVTFDTDYCELAAIVKAGPEEHCINDVTVEDGLATVDISDDERFKHPKNGKQYAISYVEFYCECPE